MVFTPLAGIYHLALNIAIITDHSVMDTLGLLARDLHSLHDLATVTMQKETRDIKMVSVINLATVPAPSYQPSSRKESYIPPISFPTRILFNKLSSMNTLAC
jgi:hypothetical protein